MDELCVIVSLSSWPEVIRQPSPGRSKQMVALEYELFEDMAPGAIRRCSIVFLTWRLQSSAASQAVVLFSSTVGLVLQCPELVRALPLARLSIVVLHKPRVGKTLLFRALASNRHFCVHRSGGTASQARSG